MEKLRANPAKFKFNKLPRVLIVAPTRELATQIGDVIGKISHSEKEFSVLIAIGGINKRGQIDQYQKEGADFVIGTPGRIQDLMQNN